MVLTAQREGETVTRFRKYAVTLLASTSLVTIVLLVTGWGSAVAAQTSTTGVRVVNTPLQPVPVKAQGTVPVAGTVNVGNLPSTQAVTGTVNVGNLPSAQATTSADTTTAIGGGSGVSVDGGQWVYSPEIDVADYKTVRVAVFCNGCTDTSQFAVYTAGREDYLLGPPQNLYNFTNAQTTGSAVYENPGTSLYVQLVNNGQSTVTFWYDVYGRRN
jgi:hypothetical protein